MSAVVSAVVDTTVATARTVVRAAHAAELARLEDRAREGARTVARRRLAVEQARAAVPDRGRFLTSRLYPTTTSGSSD